MIGRWAAAGNRIEAHFGDAAAVLINEKVLDVGGDEGDASTDDLTIMNGLSVARPFHAVSVLT